MLSEQLFLALLLQFVFYSFMGFSLRAGWIFAGFCGSVLSHAISEVGDMLRVRRKP